MTSNDVSHKLDNWRFWMGVAYFGLVLVIVALWVDWARTNADVARTSRVVAERHADIVANADAQYQQCLSSIPTFRHVNRFVSGVELVEQALLTNAKAAHVATPPGSALYVAQAKNIVRLREAIEAARQVAFHVPVAGECRALRDRLENR